MAGQIIVAIIGVVCIILSFLAEVTDTISRYGLIIFGVILIAFAGWSQYIERYPRMRKRVNGQEVEQDRFKSVIDNLSD